MNTNIVRKNKLFNNSRKSRIIVKIIILFFLGLLIVLLTKLPELLNVKSVDCHTQAGPCTPEINSQLQGLLTTPVYKIDQNTINQKVYPLKILSYKIKFPNRLALEVDSPKPAVNLTLNLSQAQYLVSEQGEVLGISNDKSLPEVVSDQNSAVEIGSIIKDFATFQATRLAAELSKRGFSYPKIYLQGDILEIRNLSEFQIIASINNDPAQIAGTLQQLLTKDKIVDSGPSKIDLRFSQPIITY